MGYVYLAPRDGSNKISLNGYNHLTWRYKMIPLIRTDNCTDMSNMFSGANYSLPETLDLRAFNTSHVTTMHSMFDNCKSETILGLDNFNTANVTDMAFMFNASKATELDLSNFNTSRVTDMENMFCNCDVEDLDISNFDTSLVTNMSSMFEGASSATIDTSSFDTSEVTTMHNMFKGTSGTTLDLSNFDTSNVTDMSGMFQSASYNSINVSSFDTSSVTNMSNMFRGSTELNLDISNFDFSDVTDISYMLSSKTLNSLTLPNNLDVSNIVNITGLFQGLNIPTLDLRGIEFESAEGQLYLFNGLHANTLDISDWDLGEHASAIKPPDYPYMYYIEYMFSMANIHEIRFSNSNVFPEGYNVCLMFRGFKTDGTLDLSSFHFNKAICTGASVTEGYSSMFCLSRINTLIMGDVTSDEFDFALSTGNTRASFFGDASMQLLDMSRSTLRIENGNNFFDGLVVTRINMPNQICINPETMYATYASSGMAKYVDYSSVDTRSANYSNDQWEYMSKYKTNYNKIVWIPSTFVLDGNHTMELMGDVYTNALSYTDLGWNEEPINAIMHYGTTHADFEQAILNDDPDEWVSPDGYELFFCHKSVPLGSEMTPYQFRRSYGEGDIYYDDVLIDKTSPFIFNELGTHKIKIYRGGYGYAQKITVVDHGETYTVLNNVCTDVTWNTSSRRYVETTSTKVQCRLYTDGYLFIYPLNTITNTNSQYTQIITGGNTSIKKVSGAPWELSLLKFHGCTQLTDISELIIYSGMYYDYHTYSHGFNPAYMFYNCGNLTDVSVIDKWRISLEGYYNSASGSYSTSTSSDKYYWSNTFAYSKIYAAPKISIRSSTSRTFSHCEYLTDISKLQSFYTNGSYSIDTGYAFTYLFEGCSRLSNVSRLKQILQKVSSSDQNTGSRYHLNLSGLLKGTAITNTDFIPDEGLPVIRIAEMFNNCQYLTDLTGVGRMYSLSSYAIDFNSAFSNIPATDYSPLSSWTCPFTYVYFNYCKMYDLSFMSNWDLSKCVGLYFNSSNNLTSISVLSGKLDTTKEIAVYLDGCTSLTSLVGLEGCILAENTSFSACSSLTSLNGLQGCTIKKCNYLFSGCSALSDITALSQVTFDNISDVTYMFSNCSSLTNLNGLQGLDISNCTSLASIFNGCTLLSNIDAIAGWRPYQVKNVSSMFLNCRSITSLYALRSWITDQLTNISSAFSGCSSLVSLNGLAGFNPGQCTTMPSVFNGCTSLTDISDIQYWYVARCTYMQSTFKGCSSLTDITPLATWNVSVLQNSQDMFQDCTSLESIAPLANWNIRSLQNMTYMFYNDTSITDADSIDVWKNIRNMAYTTRTYAFYNVPRPWPSWAVS